MSREMDRIAREVARTYGPKPTTPAESLTHVLCAFADRPTDEMAVTATTNIYDTPTGLTWGDLRAIQQQLDALEQPTPADIVPFPTRPGRHQ